MSDNMNQTEAISSPNQVAAVPQPNEANVDSKNDLVSRADLEHALRDVHRYKNDAREKEEALKKFQNQQLEQNQKYKELWEQTKKEAESYQEKANLMEKAFMNREIKRQLEMEAMKMGLIDSDAMHAFVNQDDILVEGTTTGKINVLNAKQVLEGLKLKKPYLFNTQKSVGINTQTPSVMTSNEVTMDQVMEAQSKYNKTKRKEDAQVYQDLLLKYKKNPWEVNHGRRSNDHCK
jgi:hypothetical protein